MNSPGPARCRRVTILGHVVPSPYSIRLQSNPRLAAAQVNLSNYTRVVTDDGQFMDHLAWLKQQRGMAGSDVLSVWEMYQCSSLLLTSYLRRNGFDVQLINHLDSDNETSRLSDIAAFDPDVILVSTTFVLSAQHLSGIGRKLHANFPRALRVAGGHHVAAALLPLSADEKKNYLNNSDFDVFVDDFQGEGALLKLLNAYPGDLADVANLVYRRTDGDIVVTERKIEENDINTTLIDFDNLAPGSVVHIRTARSCSFKCAFCSYPSVAGPLSLMEFDNTKATLRNAKKAKVGAVFFVDDTFNVPPDRFEALLDWMISEDINLPWYSFLRCQYVNEKLVAKMKQSGCVGVFLGIESGSDRILKNMKKGAVSGFYRNGIRWLKEAGIITVGAFIVGFPGETAETVEETRALIENYGLDFYFLQPFYFLHHTPIAKRAKEFGLSGNGLFWQHRTMNNSEAFAHINKLFASIENSIFVNPDYTLWEIAYLRSKGFDLDEIKNYRRTINAMTLRQTELYGTSSDASTTSRVAPPTVSARAS